MLRLAFTVPVGLIAGVALAFTHRSLKGKGVAIRIGIGLVAGLGIATVLNAAIDSLQLAAGGLD